MVIEVYSQGKFRLTRKRLAVPDDATFGKMVEIISTKYIKDYDPTHLYHFLLNKSGKFKFNKTSKSDLIISHENAMDLINHNCVLNADKFKVSCCNIFKESDEIGFVYDYGEQHQLIVRCFARDNNTIIKT